MVAQDDARCHAEEDPEKDPDFVDARAQSGLHRLVGQGNADIDPHAAAYIARTRRRLGLPGV